MNPQLLHSKRIVVSWIMVASLLALAGCARETPAAATPGAPTPTATPRDQTGNATSVPLATDTPAPTIAVRGGATVATVVGISASPMGTPMATPVPGPTVAGQGAVITLNNNGQTITMNPGERFSLQLGDDLEWSVTSSDPAVLSRVVNILAVRGSQGVYEAHQPGQATLSATGDAACRKAKPPCMVPSRAFSIRVTVQ
ncbi:MAG TPA: hypothetical protein VGA61_12840 [Anaerolineae bacterium]